MWIPAAPGVEIASGPIVPAMPLRKIIRACCPPGLNSLLERLEKSDAVYRVVKGSFWIVIGALISRGLMFAAIFFVSRVLGKTCFGEFGMIRSTVEMFAALANFGLWVTVAKHVAELRKANPERAGRIIALLELVAMATGGVVLLGTFLFAPWLSVHAMNAPHLSSAVQIGTVMLFLSPLNCVQTGALCGFEAFKTIAKANLATGIISFPVLIAGAYFWDLPGAVLATVVNLCLGFTINRFAVRVECRRHKVPVSVSGSTGDFSILWKFSLPAALGAIVFSTANWTCGALLVNRPGGYGEMGIFSATNQWLSMLLFLPVLFGNVILPVLSERLGQKDVKQSFGIMFLAIRANALLVIPIAVIAGVASPWIMSLYGEGFRSGWPVLLIVLASSGILALQMPVGQVIVASGKIWIGFAMNAVWAIMFVLLTLQFVGKGAFGVASARALCYAVQAACSFAFAVWFIRAHRAKS